MSEGEYEVERIVASKIVPGTNKTSRHYRVKWKGYDMSEATWEPFENLQQSRKALEDFHRKNPDIPNPFEVEEEFVPKQTPVSKKRGRPTKSTSKYGESAAVGAAQLQGKAVKPPPMPGFPKKPAGKTKQHPASSMAVSIVKPVSIPTQYTPNQNQIEVGGSAGGKPAKKEGSNLKVTALYSNPTSNEVFFRVEDGAKSVLKPRKWAVKNCKRAMIDFYRSCIRIKQ